MRGKAKNLIFISRIKRDGSGTYEPLPEEINFLKEENHNFELICLSMREGTYIAKDFNCYVVKLEQGQE
mgnify:CR=1 FL=1